MSTRQIVFAEEVRGNPGAWLVTLECGHKLATREQLVDYECRECSAEESPTRPPRALNLRMALERTVPALPLPGDIDTRIARIERVLLVIATHPWVDRELANAVSVALKWEPKP